MNDLVVDASAVIKLLVAEPESDCARLLYRYNLHAPDLILIECANVLWKKYRRAELSDDEAITASQLLATMDIALTSSRDLLAAATGLAVRLDHPACDCAYVALAERLQCGLVTADESLARKLGAAKIKCGIIPLTRLRQLTPD